MGSFFGDFWENVFKNTGGVIVQKKGYKGRCEKRMLPKCHGVCRTFNAIQYAYADILQNDVGIKEIRCNVLLDGLPEGEYIIIEFAFIDVF